MQEIHKDITETVRRKERKLKVALYKMQQHKSLIRLRAPWRKVDLSEIYCLRKKEIFIMEVGTENWTANSTKLNV